MKKIILGLILIGLAMQSYGQDVLFQAKIKKEKVPAVIIESIPTLGILKWLNFMQYL